MDTGFVILIPVVFMSIAYNVYLHYQRIRTHSAEDLFLSLNYLLNRQTHEAVDVFKKRVNHSGYNFETYLALGNLYRHEGKLDEAIHVHETIIAQKVLKRKFRSHALYELATDYLQAGILDKAEQIFLEISLIDDYTLPSQRALLDIYQQLSDWPRAIDIASMLAEHDPAMWSLIMHFHCEMIDAYLAREDYPRALACITHAQEVDSEHPRLMLGKAHYYLAMGSYQLAIETIKTLCLLEPSYVLLTYKWLYRCCEQLNIAFIDQIVPLLNASGSVYATIDAALFLLECMEAHEVFEQLVNPVLSQQALPACLTALYTNGTNTSLTYQDLLSVLALSMGNKQPYSCHGCGFSSQTFYWKCPGCRTWGTKLAAC
jgi:lipopolysaccharide biosynthesis regulator YciM